MSVFQKIESILEDPYIRAKEEKERGRKVIGVTPMHFPEELVHASGALPIVMQETNEPITTGWSHIFPNYCAFSRSNVDWAAKGKLDFLDAIIISDVCLMTRVAFSIVRQRVSIPVIYMWWPLEYKMERWRAITLSRLQRCKRELEEIVGRRIDDRRIQESAEVYNHNRRLLRRVYELRRSKPGVLQGREMQLLVISGMVMPKEEHNSLLEEIIPELESRPVPEGAAKVFLSGHLCHGVKPDVLDLVEDAGAVVVGDDLYAGYRYFAAEVTVGASPMEAMVRRYFDIGLPCPTRCGPEGDWAEYIIRTTRETQAQGVISLIPKYCEAHMFYYPYLKDRLMDAGIPETFVETEHEAVSLGRVRTRIQALVEILKD